MGYLAAVDMKEQVGFDDALRWHLKSNLFPAPPSYMFDPCKEAILAYQDEEYDLEIELPEGVLYRGSSVAPASAFVENFRLEAFLDE